MFLFLLMAAMVVVLFSIAMIRARVAGREAIIYVASLVLAGVVSASALILAHPPPAP
ncbi:MAG: hypothetical protein KGJ23_11260 [Euryarchaeota archaeon]|nr:hypothetical protein [Euryarchaeota archaeon]MDE1837172.1 hypothetical protein [Euryarchaeota archaeon]MDE1881096.1 hypothetical protein [Euryarchaeota archaeon]MDE2045328.1 hypothetical protein [Thermoplasmata archaeon]